MSFRRFGHASLAGAVLLLGGCALPANGPKSSAILLQQPEAAQEPQPRTPEEAGFAVIDVTPDVGARLAQSDNPTLHETFGDSQPKPNQTIGVGDTVSVSIWEAQLGGLFSAPIGSTSGPGKSVTLPPEVVDTNGTIGVPFAGRIDASGHTAPEIARLIERSLKGKAIDPQVVVTVLNNNSSMASVIGNVTTAGRVKLDVRGERIVDVIASAGGPRLPDYETRVQLTRGGRVASVPLQTILATPQENIFVQPDDTIYLADDPRMIAVLGAVSSQGQFKIDQPRLTLAGAIGKAGGLVDSRADADGVFLFRFEPVARFRALEPNSPLLQRYHDVVPTVYRMRLSDPRTFYTLQTIDVRKNDVLFVANAKSYNVVKLLTFIRAGTGIIGDIAGTTRTVNDLN